MKKSVLAVAIAAAAFAASAASAAQVYDKDGTTLAVGGQVEFMAGNAGTNYFSNSGNDASTRDRARLTMSGRTQLTSGIAAYAYNEWQVQHSGDSKEAQDLTARQQYLGVDFGTFGKVQMGRYKDPFVFASSAVDVLDDVGVYGGNDERNSGHLSYMWKGFGFDAGISYQFAVDNYKTDTDGEINVDSGFSVYAGYTSPSVVFGPISVRAGYLYLKAQDANDGREPNYTKTVKGKTTDEDGNSYGWTSQFGGYVDNLKTVDVSLSWGVNGKGLYVATNYAYSKASYADDVVNNKFTCDAFPALNNTHDITTSGSYDHKVKAWETVATYGFENGIRIGASYHFIKHQFNGNLTSDKVLGLSDFEQKYVQLIADYNVTPNFKVWAETLFDAGSDDYHAKFNASDKKDGNNSVLVGARYVF